MRVTLPRRDTRGGAILGASSARPDEFLGSLPTTIPSIGRGNRATIIAMDQLLELSAGTWITGLGIGFLAWFTLRYAILGIYTVGQDERAVLTSFGRAQRISAATTIYTAGGDAMRASERERYEYPQVRVIGPGGPYFRWPWQQLYKASISTRTVNMAWDPENPTANNDGTLLEAVTKDQLNVGLTGQIRFRVSEDNLYAYLFGVKNPPAHIMGFFVSILRERIANFEAPRALAALAAAESADEAPPTALDRRSPGMALDRHAGSVDPGAISGISINDLRKNLRLLNEIMDQECASSVARYGVHLDASLITEISPPQDVESALAAINTAHNHVSSDISLAQASADQRIVQSRRAVEIETLRAEAEVEPLRALAAQLAALQAESAGALEIYVRNMRLGLYAKADRAFLENK
jgi:regulator of protease activity HflC (stomatin/prohibitin superfamily)